MTTFNAPRLRRPEATSPMTVTEAPMVQRFTSKEINQMLMYEDLARARMREAEQDAARRRLARRVVSIQRWRRLEKWVHRHVRAAEARIER